MLRPLNAVTEGAEGSVNGVRVGYPEGEFTGRDADGTDAVRPARRNLFALRVRKVSPSESPDGGDVRHLGGLSHDTDPKAAPATQASRSTSPRRVFDAG